MDLQALGNIGEFVGAFGVVASLIYLAGQVRHARRVASAESLRELQADFNNATRMIVSDTELARVWYTGSLNRDALSPVEKMRFDYLLSLHVELFTQMYIAHEQGLMDEEVYERYRTWVAMILNNPATSPWWEGGAEGPGMREFYKPAVSQSLEDARRTVPPAMTLLEVEFDGPEGVTPAS